MKLTSGVVVHFAPESLYILSGILNEYYRSDISDKPDPLNEKIRSNVFLVNNVTVEQEGTKFIFSILWSKINPAYQWHIERAMNDFHLIRYDGFRFSSTRFTELHLHCLQFVQEELRKDYPGRMVVATHHVPTFMHYPEQYKGDVLNEAFAVELFDMIESTGPDFWIYGHHHSNTPDFSIGETQMRTNQLGYVGNGEHLLFRQDKTIDLDH
ncbi:MAG: metallophosphoesterase [Bacteroidales bacterium]|nr:metallophosphoesterase [Bacteroidales bacterium]